MIHPHEEENEENQNQAADQEADPEDEVGHDQVAIDQVVVNLDLYHQLNIKNNVILVIAKIQHGHDV